MAATVYSALSRDAGLAIRPKIRDNIDKSVIWIILEIKLVSKTDQAAKLWTKPELVKLGALKDVAGGNPVPTQNQNNS